jgi:hypothetical protein
MAESATCPRCAEEGDASPRRITARGLCRKHYLRAYRAHEFEPGRPGPVPGQRYCSVTGCGKPHKGHGYCRSHLYAAQQRGEVEGPAWCSFDGGCDNLATAHDLCTSHARQRRAGKPLTPLRPYQSREGTCPGPGCGLPIHSGGYCSGHYRQAHESLPLTPIERDTIPRGTPCWVGGEQPCGRPSLTRDGVCRGHYDYRRSGDEDWQRPIPTKAPNGAGHLDKQGYRLVQQDGRQRREHHVLTERLLDRSLLPTENVHHINGDRADNHTDGEFVMDERGRLRSGNLEVWSTSQPAGQEVGPKVAWAVDLLWTYHDVLPVDVVERVRSLAAYWREGPRHAQAAARRPDGSSVEVDWALVPLLEAVWALGVETRYSCQESVGGVAYVMFDTEEGASLVRALLGAQPWLWSDAATAVAGPTLSFPSRQIADVTRAVAATVVV